MDTGAAQTAESFSSRTVVVSRDPPPAASAGGPWTKPAAPARAVMVRKRRRVCVVGMRNLPVLLTDHAFSSRLTSFRKRQSVPLAMIFCGLLLIMLAHAAATHRSVPCLR